MSVLVLADHDGTSIKPATLSAIAAAGKLGNDCDLLLLGGAEAQAVAESAQTIAGLRTIRVASDTAWEHASAEDSAPLIAELAGDYAAVVAPVGSFAKNLLPRVAAILDVQPITEVLEIVSADTFVRPLYAGNALATVRSRDEKKLLTVRATSFEAVADTGGSATIEAVSGGPPPSGLSAWTADEVSASVRPELTNARIVISGGRGMQSGEHFALLESVADKLGAAVGASRAAVDAGYVPNEYQVGQTGKVVAPDLYIAVGISGAIQHLAGMKDSKVIAAINNDPEAPIFQVADYGLVADLFEALPALDKALD